MLFYIFYLIFEVKSNFKIDGFTYKILDANQSTVQVVQCSHNANITIYIPSHVNYNETDYSITSISSDAFSSQFSAFENLYFPYTLINIEPKAFDGSPHLQNLGYITEQNEIINNTIPPLITFIDTNVFSNCPNIHSINLNNVIELKNYAFQNCVNLTNVELPIVEIIGSQSFTSTNLHSITLPKSLRKIEYKAFEKSSIVYIKGEVPNLISIDHSFSYCSNLEEIPELIGIVTIDGNSFEYCEKLKNVFCGQNLTKIGSFSFGSCSSLESFTTTSQRYAINFKAFFFCHNLKSFNFQGVAALGGSVFGNSGLEGELDLSTTSIKKIEDYMFFNCNDFTAVKLPPNLTSFSSNSFSYTTVHSLYFTGTNGVLNLDNQYKDFEYIVYEIIFDPSCNITLNNAFRNYKYLSRVVLPSTKYGLLYTFLNCQNLTRVENFQSCFYNTGGLSNCVNLIYIDSFESLNDIGSNAFSNCISIESFPKINVCTDIGEYAFYNCSKLKSIEIGKQLSYISKYAFMNCISLEEIFLDHTSRFGLDFNCFSNCISLKKFDFICITSTLFDVFSNCSSLTEADMKNAIFLNKLELGMFRDCVSLKKIEFPRNVYLINSECFMNCVNIETINISKGTQNTRVGEMTFANCYKLKNVTFNQLPKYINNYAFSSCISLEKVLLSSNFINTQCTEIHNFAFINCSKLKIFDFEKMPISYIGEKAFYGCELSEKITLKGNSSLLSISIMKNAFCSNQIKIVDFQYKTGSLVIDHDSFQNCININCVKCDKKFEEELSEVFDKEIINAEDCPKEDDDDAENNKNKRKKVPIYVPIIISIVVVLLVIAVIIFVLKRRTKRSHEPKSLTDTLISQN